MPFEPVARLSREERERRLVEELRKGRRNAFCVGPLLTLAGIILGLVLADGAASRSWKEQVWILLIPLLWTVAGLVMILWASFWTPEAWARLVLERDERRRARSAAKSTRRQRKREVARNRKVDKS